VFAVSGLPQGDTRKSRLGVTRHCRRGLGWKADIAQRPSGPLTWLGHVRLGHALDAAGAWSNRATDLLEGRQWLALGVQCLTALPSK
jgi:hypothetical protein